MPGVGRVCLAVLATLSLPSISCHRSSAVDNSAPPLWDDDVQQRAKGLFAAIVADDPSLAEPFWFPRAPFIPLKDVPDPPRYWDTLHHTYATDIHIEHGARASWEGATFDRFELGPETKWIVPGEEYNTTGYYRSLHCTLRYRVGDSAESIPLEAAITWQGRWFVTHLRKYKK
jgi:hypothetical protein